MFNCQWINTNENMGYYNKWITFRFLTIFFTASVFMTSHALPDSCLASELDQCLESAYRIAGVVLELPNSSDVHFVSNYGILQLSVLVYNSQTHARFCSDVFPLLDLDALTNCIRPKLQLCSTALLYETAAEVDPDSVHRVFQETFLQMMTDLLYWSNHFLSSYVYRMCDNGCERLPERNAATYECLDVPGTFDNLDTRDPAQDYISYNGQYCRTARTLTNCIWAEVEGCYILEEEMLSLIYFLQHMERYTNFAHYWGGCRANENLIPPTLPGASPCEHNGYMRCVAINLKDAGADLGYSDGPMTDEHSVALEVLVNDHDQICRYVPSMDMEKLQQCVLDTGRGCIGQIEQLFTYSELHRMLNWICREECADKVSRQDTMERTCQIDRMKSEVESLHLELNLGEDVSGYCTALSDDLSCAAEQSGTCPLLWDNLVQVEQAFNQRELETVSDECNVSFDIYAEPCGKEDPAFRTCIGDAIPRVRSVTSTLQETLQVITSMSQRQHTYCENVLPYINVAELNRCINDFHRRCDGTYFSIWMEMSRPTLSDALNNMCEPECFNYNARVRYIGRSYLDSLQIEVFSDILRQIKNQGSNEALCHELLTHDDNALYHAGECVPLQTIYEDQLVMYQRQLDSEDIIVKDEIQRCRGGNSLFYGTSTVISTDVTELAWKPTTSVNGGNSLFYGTSTVISTDVTELAWKPTTSVNGIEETNSAQSITFGLWMAFTTTLCSIFLLF